MNTADIIHPYAKAYHNVETTQNYIKGRPSLPLETIDFIKNNFNLTPQSKILDLASGTGKFTELLAGYGGFNDITAVEPSPEFRDACEKILTGVSKERPEFTFRILDGVASNIPLPDNSVDAMFVSQAFHWFSNEESLREMIRVVKRGAPIILVWYQLDESDETYKELIDLYRVHFNDVNSPQFKTYQWKSAFENESLNEIIDINLKLEKFRFYQVCEREGLYQRILSISYIAALSEERKKEIISEMGKILDKNPDTAIGKTLYNPYNVELYYTFKK